MKPSTVVRVLVALVIVGALCTGVKTGSVHAQVSRPNPSATPQADTKGAGLPKLATNPTCSDGGGIARMYSDSSGNCVYACLNGTVKLIAAGARACGLATAAPSATPTPTATATPTKTATATPTPTATSTP